MRNEIYKIKYKITIIFKECEKLRNTIEAYTYQIQIKENG